MATSVCTSAASAQATTSDPETTPTTSSSADIIELGRATASACLIDDDDFGSSDEVKIFKDEGEDEEKEFASHEELQAALSEDKSSLIQETELSIVKQEALRLSDHSGKSSAFVWP